MLVHLSLDFFLVCRIFSGDLFCKSPLTVLRVNRCMIPQRISGIFHPGPCLLHPWASPLFPSLFLFLSESNMSCLPFHLVSPNQPLCAASLHSVLFKQFAVYLFDNCLARSFLTCYFSSFTSWSKSRQGLSFFNPPFSSVEIDLFSFSAQHFYIFFWFIELIELEYSISFHQILFITIGDKKDQDENE